MFSLTPKQSRDVDRLAVETYGIPSIILMENAARGVADAVDALRIGRNLTHDCVVLAGKGNNGGDGLAAARHLHARGYHVTVVLCDAPDAFTGDALTNFNIIKTIGLPICRVNDLPNWEEEPFCGVVVDAIYGTGYRPPPRIHLGELRQRVAAQMAGVVAVDLPSGMDADTGHADPANVFSADITVTFGAEKAGFSTAEALHHTGRIVIADLGVPRTILEQAAAVQG
jgi:NAD(P)H-hydrate epimerase